MKGADAQLLQFTPWKGNLSRRYAPAVAILRISLLLIFRQRLFWALLALATLAFFFFFYAQYLLVWISQQLAQETIRIAGFPVSVSNLLRFLDRLALNGSAHTYGNFIWFQGYIIVILLAFSGSQLFGNDIVYGSMLFYYSKPISLWHYFYGKCFTIVILLLMTTFIPAVILWIEAGLLFDWKMYYTQNYQLLLGIGGYSALIALTLSLLTAATALLFRRTTPLVLTWMGLFVLLRLISNWLTLATQDANWRLLDLWNNLYLCGLWCFGVDHATIRPVPQPNYGAACLVIVGIIILCLVYINLYLKNLYR